VNANSGKISNDTLIPDQKENKGFNGREIG
jgi:hypothetical protein